MTSRFKFFDVEPDPEKWRRRKQDKQDQSETKSTERDLFVTDGSDADKSNER